MSKAHKEALAKGRQQSRVVRDYLASLERTKKRGPKADKKSLTKRINEVSAQIADEEDASRRLELVQKRLDLEERLADLTEAPDRDKLEKEFIKVAAEYSDRKGITYPAWREIGVSPGVLKSAGVKRTRRTA